MALAESSGRCHHGLPLGQASDKVERLPALCRQVVAVPTLAPFGVIEDIEQRWARPIMRLVSDRPKSRSTAAAQSVVQARTDSRAACTLPEPASRRRRSAVGRCAPTRRSDRVQPDLPGQACVIEPSAFAHPAEDGRMEDDLRTGSRHEAIIASAGACTHPIGRVPPEGPAAVSLAGDPHVCPFSPWCSASVSARPVRAGAVRAASQGRHHGAKAECASAPASSKPAAPRRTRSFATFGAVPVGAQPSFVNVIVSWPFERLAPNRSERPPVISAGASVRPTLRWPPLPL